ncbi:MAG: hypothetical protein U7M05_09545 [Candidatus Igneacidithiobacillus chanchocoensis]
MTGARSLPWWLLSWILYGVLVALDHHFLLRLPNWRWTPAVAYGTWAFLALGAIARTWPRLGPYAWRPLVIFLGAILAGLDTFSSSGIAAQHINGWMMALIGIALVSIIARFVPGRWAQWWFGQEVLPGTYPRSSR